jgi:hypothetical protein
MMTFKFSGIPSRLAPAGCRPLQSAAIAAITVEVFFFIVALPFREDEDSVNEFPFCTALGSNAWFEGSDLLTMPIGLVPDRSQIDVNDPSWTR